MLALILPPASAPTLGGQSSAEAAGSAVQSGLLAILGLTVAKVGAFVTLMPIVGARILPRLLDRVVATGSRELFNPAILVTRPAHIGLNTWESRGGSPPAPGSTGLFHTAILYPTRAALADALRRVTAAGIRLDGASDHGVSEALYLRDPDENGVELYWDRPPEQWPRTPEGELAMFTRRLDLGSLLQEGAEA